jgi:Protein of unknown function (DUF3757)
MRYKLPFVLLLAPFGVFAKHHCPAIYEIKQTGGVYTAQATGGGEWIGILQGTVPQLSAIRDFSEALLIIDNGKKQGNIIDQGRFQKCTYNLQAEGKQIDMSYENKTWQASISGKPHWEYHQTAFLEIYQCAGVAAEECEFDILEQDPTSDASV